MQLQAIISNHSHLRIFGISIPVTETIKNLAIPPHLNTKYRQNARAEQVLSKIQAQNRKPPDANTRNTISSSGKKLKAREKTGNRSVLRP